MMVSFNGRTQGMCDFKEGTCNSDLEVRETLLEEVTCTETWKKHVMAEGSEGGGMFQREGTAYVRVLDA